MHTLIYFGVVLLLMYLFLRKDINNYRYCKKCFKMIKRDPQMSKLYKDMGVTRLGVLYLTRNIPIGTPDEYHDEILTGELKMLDEALMMMNLIDIAKGERRSIGKNDKDIIYLVKIVPTFRKLSIRYVLVRLVLALIGLFLINKLGLWDNIDTLFNNIWKEVQSWIGK